MIIDNNLLMLASALVAALLTWLLTFFILRQKYHMMLENQRNEMESAIALLDEKLKTLSQSDETHRSLLAQSQKKLQEEKNRSIELDQYNAIYKERINGLNEKVAQYKRLKEAYRALEEVFEQSRLELSTELSTARSQLAEYQKQLTTLENHTLQQQEKMDQIRSELGKAENRNGELETLLESERKQSMEKLALLQENKEQMKMEFKALADTILKNNSEQFSQQNSENLNRMITPIREQFDPFKKQINDVYIKETKERSALQGEIRLIKELNEEMRKDAKNLTNALKGESKTQGVWGEMILERVLENSGLREGESYRREVSLEHESDHKRYRPDVIVYLPDKREIIIDAKTSLRAYEQYISSKDETEKKRFADQHITSVKKHVRELSDKDYTGLKGVETLDFIFMFVPIESALLMAMEYDPGIFDFAFKKNVILVGPTTLMVALRAVENTWKQEHQQRNAIEIARRAGLLYDKFVGFVESVDKLGKQINTVQKTYEETYTRLHSGAGSLTSQFKKKKKLGAAASKRLPEHVLREIEA